MENTQQKKGLPALAWVGIGCGVLILIVLILVVAGGWFVSNKVKDFAGDYEKNPELTAARMIVKMNPEIEEVGVDEDAGTITIREKETGKEITANFKDIKEGKFTLTGEDGETVTFESEQDEDGGSMRVETSEGSWTVGSGSKSAPVPDWVPVPAEAETTMHHSMTDGSGFGGSLSFTYKHSMDDLVGYYEDALKSGGYTVAVNRFSSDAGQGAVVTGMNDAEQRSVTVTVGEEDDGLSVGVAYAQESATE
ncbi:MAG TPA: hypothetical protein PLV45_12985 [bacterium]|nr:hypothetical protein [bacterium]